MLHFFVSFLYIRLNSVVVIIIATVIVVVTVVVIVVVSVTVVLIVAVIVVVIVAVVVVNRLNSDVFEPPRAEVSGAKLSGVDLSYLEFS